jgi:hypothetical protein
MKILTLTLFTMILLTAGCASPEAIGPCVDINQADGILMGILHGFIAPITFIVSFFVDDVSMYAVNNSGWLYDLGFLIGIGGFSGGILKGNRRRKRRRS